jgi:hypothetical protein
MSSTRYLGPYARMFGPSAPPPKPDPAADRRYAEAQSRAMLREIARLRAEGK